jgi:NADPH-dependent curcumin reductase CurA
MTSTINRQFRLAARPHGMVKASDFELREEPVPTPGEGQVLVKVLLVSLDPAMRGWMNEGKSYVPPVALGAVMRAGTVGKVVASKNPKFKEGQYVSGLGGVQQYALSDGSDLRVVDEKLAPLPHYLGGLGMTGLSAYFGLFEIGQPKPGETVVVSGAAGAVGTVVGQLAKIHGCTVVGIAGGPEKCAYLKELGFDAAIDYKSENLHEALKAHCPKGIDVYFDNVGGPTLEAALGRLAKHARVVICGAISQYNATEAPKGPSNYLSLLVNRARMEGFVVFDFAAKYGTALAELAKHYAAGKLKLRDTVVEGFDSFPEKFLMLFKGENTGKLVLKIAEG